MASCKPGVLNGTAGGCHQQVYFPLLFALLSNCEIAQPIELSVNVILMNEEHNLHPELGSSMMLIVEEDTCLKRVVSTFLCTEMKSAWFVLLVCLSLHNSPVTAGQHTAADDEPGGEAVPLEQMLQRAETMFIRSMMMKIGEEQNANVLDADWPPAGRAFKRQHPGKRSEEEFEKRQHPGKRGQGEEQEGESLEADKRQHPGRRSAPQYSGENAGRQLAKRQHPGKRFLLYNKRQHPGRRGWEHQSDSGESEPAEGGQQPPRRYLETAGGSSELPFLCDPQYPVTCSKASELLELLGNMNKSRAEGKRQHPGRRLVSGDELEGQD
uniref:pro-thyrotropin-releasing hormone n=1 Tax=Pristiophorus japonicus TaxID=55135 RepID=UPI00398F7341